MKKGTVNPLMISAIVVVLVAVGIGAMMMNKQSTSGITEEAAQTQNTKDTPQTSPEVAGATASAKTIDVEAGSFYYKPNEIRVKKGETVKIVLHSVSMMHDFNIDELNVKMPITKAGNTGTVEFVADKVGTFEYYCSVGQHRAQGQVGKLIIEE